MSAPVPTQRLQPNIMYVFCVAMIMQTNVEATDFNLLNKYYLRHYRIFLNKSGLNALPTMSFT